MRRSRGQVIVGSILIAVVLLVTPVVCSQSEQNKRSRLNASDSDSQVATILARMEQARLANQQNFRPYTVTREYKLFDNETKAQREIEPNSQVIASVEFVPPNHKTFQIDKVEGSDRGKNIVKHILENESEMASKGAPVPLTRQYYEFRLLGEAVMNGQSCWVLELKPLHDDRAVIRGKAWVDKSTYLTHEVQGEMAKSPSWWIKKVQTTIRYGSVGGMWLPTSTYSVADVRFFGRHVLTSQALSLETSDQVAHTFPSSVPGSSLVNNKVGNHVRHGRVPPVVGAGVYVPR